MPVPDPALLLSVSCNSLPMSGSVSLLAYGSVPGMELIPYFLALLAWVGMAIGAIFLSPITALVRRIRRVRRKSALESKSEAMTTPPLESKSETVTPLVPELRCDDNVQA
jgi:hypothetical protein